MLIRLTVRVFRGRWSSFVCVLLSPFGIEDGMLDVIVLISLSLLSIYFTLRQCAEINRFVCKKTAFRT